MELRQLRYFVTLAEVQNFHRAAERLSISQPPLTVAIRKLEEELGAPLFLRGPRGVSLTPAGRAALDIARAALAQADRLREAVREGIAGERGRLRVGFVGSAIFELLPRIIPAYRRRFPHVELILAEANSLEIARRLCSGELDVGLVRLPLLEIAAVDVQVIDQDELYAAVHIGSRFARADNVPLSALAQEPFILHSRLSVLHAIALMACHDAGFVPQVAQEAEQINAVLSLVHSGLGVALVPGRARSAVPQGVRLVRLSQKVAIESGLALARGTSNRLARNFADIASGAM